MALRIQNGWFEKIKFFERLLERGADLFAIDIDGKDALFYAACYGKDISVIKYLLNNGFDINKKYFTVGGTILHAIAKTRHWDRSNMMVWKFILQNGADVNVLNENGYTPLMLSICHDWYMSDELEMAKFLLRYGADRSVRGFDGMTFDSIAKKRKLILVVLLAWEDIKSIAVVVQQAKNISK